MCDCSVSVSEEGGGGNLSSPLPYCIHTSIAGFPSGWGVCVCVRVVYVLYGTCLRSLPRESPRTPLAVLWSRDGGSKRYWLPGCMIRGGGRKDRMGEKIFLYSTLRKKESSHTKRGIK